jgi:hypothetical protein
MEHGVGPRGFGRATGSFGTPPREKSCRVALDCVGLDRPLGSCRRRSVHRQSVSRVLPAIHVSPSEVYVESLGEVSWLV